jgi:hypothetical protein
LPPKNEVVIAAAEKSRPALLRKLSKRVLLRQGTHRLVVSEFVEEVFGHHDLRP